MQLSEWISLFLAAATIFGVIIALIFGIRSIRENRVLQIIRYKIELLEKLSDWITSVQACVAEDFIHEDYISVSKTKPNPHKFEELLRVNWHRRRNAFFKVIEEGKVNGFPLAYILGKEISEAVKLLSDDLQKTAESFVKYTKIIDTVSKDKEVTKICEDFDNEYLKNLKSITESTAKLLGEVFNTRVSLFDCYLSGSNSFSKWP